MGFEVTYYFHEKEESGYNTEEKKEIKRKIGDPFEDVPLETLAVAIMKQLARRDIWVIDVEIYELAKKQISFRESKGGVIIRNKKFALDQVDISNFVSEDIGPQKQVVYPHEKPQVTKSVGVDVPVQQGEKRVRQWVTFEPGPHGRETEKLQFTSGKNYPVYSVKAGNLGSIYLTEDDHGREKEVDEKYFVPARKKLIGEEEVGGFNNNNSDGGTLLYQDRGGIVDMPDISQLRGRV